MNSLLEKIDDYVEILINNHDELIYKNRYEENDYGSIFEEGGGTRYPTYNCSCCQKTIYPNDWQGRDTPMLGCLHDTPMCIDCWKQEMDQREIVGTDRIEFLTFVEHYDETDYEDKIMTMINREPQIFEYLGIINNESDDESGEVDYFEYAVADEFIQKEIYAGAELP